MPRRRRKSIQAKKEPLVFTESPVNIIHRLPSPILSARHPPTAQSVPVEDCSDVSWEVITCKNNKRTNIEEDSKTSTASNVSPQFSTVPLDGHGLQRCTRGRKHARRNVDVNRTSHEPSNSVNFMHANCSKFKSLRFVGDSVPEQTEIESINVNDVTMEIGGPISGPGNIQNIKRSQQITLKQRNRKPFHRNINEEGHKDNGADVDKKSNSSDSCGSVDEDTENSIERCNVKHRTRKCKHNFTKIKKKVSPKNKSDTSTSEQEDGTRNVERVFKKFKSGRKRMYTNGLNKDDSGRGFRGDNHVFSQSVDGTSPQNDYDKNDLAPVKDLFPEYSAADKIEKTLAVVRQHEDIHTFRSATKYKKRILEESFSNNSSYSETEKDANDINFPTTHRFKGLKMLFLNCSPPETKNTDQCKILVQDTPESEYGIPYRKRQIRKQR